MASATTKSDEKISDDPADWQTSTRTGGPVIDFVAKNFEGYRRYSSKRNILVQFYTQDSDLCKSLDPTWKELGAKFKDREDIAIAKVDAKSGEVKGVKIQSFPTIIFFPANYGEVIEYVGDRKLDALVQFLKEYDIVDLTSEDVPDED
uniref:Thioredoxin domain-containing protein n=1 Tax=Panagrolaimus davidi TaxID=227884 RepID=A0A914QPG7_9BILA